MIRVAPFGEAAVLVELGEAIDVELSARVTALADAVRTSDLPGLGAPIPGYASVVVPLDPLVADMDLLVGRLERLAAATEGRRARGRPGPRASNRLVELPTRYGGADGPDLGAVAAAHDLRETDVVELHASVEYVVHFLGFSPGFAYLGILPEEIATPRHERPRERVPAGSVGIADRQTGVYPGRTPGGWQLIGRTDAVIWDSRRERPALFEPGGRVRFVPLPD